MLTDSGGPASILAGISIFLGTFVKASCYLSDIRMFAECARGLVDDVCE